MIDLMFPVWGSTGRPTCKLGVSTGRTLMRGARSAMRGGRLAPAGHRASRDTF